MGITEVITAARSPWQNAYVERVIGSIRRECLDHIVIFNERHLRRVLSSYVGYYHRTRTHLSLNKDCPDSRPIQPRSSRKASPTRPISLMAGEAVPSVLHSPTWRIPQLSSARRATPFRLTAEARLP
jgi:hypothetical protein